jgi:hypothetical protein
MEQQLEEYSEVIRDQRKQIHSITTSIIAKQWVKKKGKSHHCAHYFVTLCGLIVRMMETRQNVFFH